jgi:hypothetical protein
MAYMTVSWRSAPDTHGAGQAPMSALPPKADISVQVLDVRVVP